MSSHDVSRRVIKIRPINQEEVSKSEEAEHEQIQKLQEEARVRFEEATKRLEEAKAKSTQLLDENRQQIQQEKNHWAEEREAIVEQAKEEGFKEGSERGQEQGYQDFLEKLQQANTIIEQAGKEHQSIVGSSEETILEIALRCAEKIVNQHLQESPEAFLNIVKKAIKDVQDQPEISVFVHSDQYSHVLSQREELQTITDMKTELSIYVKEDIALNSCIIESPFGRVDAGVDSQLREIRMRLYELAHEESVHE